MAWHRVPSHHLLLGMFLVAAIAAPVVGQRSASSPPSSSPSRDVDPALAEEKRQEETVRRFLTLLEKAPRKGTALDRVYGYHVERGTLDDFVKTYAERTALNPNDGAAWMILGLVESQRGRDAAAVAALRQAETTRPEDPLPCFYLGQALVLVGQPEVAAAAFERALARKPSRNDLMEIFQALGRVYERTQKTEEALAVWNRLEALFPNDLRVQEQIASALAEEGQTQQALARFEVLARKVADPFRQVQLAMQAADLKVRLGQTEPALHDFESLLGKLRPDSWLHREVRHRIEEVFLRNDDQAGLVAYYERWIKKNPEDIEALVRVGRTLAGQGNSAAAHTWYEKALKLAPSRRDLRLALIGQLAQDRKFAEAAAQYEAMDKAEPNNPDTLRDWGGLLLRDTTKPEAERKAAAGAVWRKLLDSKPKDPVTTAQVADLFRQGDMPQEALALYRSAVDLAPTNPQYYEYLGEYLHALKRPEEAQATWVKIAAGPNRNAKNLARLGEVLSGFGYLAQAIGPFTEAVALEGDDFSLRMKLADLLHRCTRYDDARVQLAAAEKLADKEEEKAATLDALVKNDQAAGRLAGQINALTGDLERGPASQAKPEDQARVWARLARYLEADSKPADAVRAIERAVELAPRSVPAWTLAARLRESAGNLGDAANAFRRLADIDRRNRTEHLTGVAKLEARLGRVDAALKAGRDLIAAAPGNPESYQFFAELCFQLGRNDEGVDTLRRAVRVNPNEPKVILALAETLAGQYRTDEAIEIYWKAFEKAEDLEAKLGMVTRLTDLYLQRNQFDRLLARLQSDQNESQKQAQQREFAICMAQAYASSGDLGMARSELEHLLSANTRDTQLLQQLSKLAEEEGDAESAAKYQKQLLELAPSDDGSTRLAQLYVRLGEIDEAQAVWTKMAAGKSQADRVFQALDSLIANDKPKAALEVTEGLLRKDPRDWEALYRKGVALANLKRDDDASRQFRELLELRLNEDEKSAIVKARTRDPKLSASVARPSRYQRGASLPIEDRISMVSQIRFATRLDPRMVIRSAAYTWAPQDFGQARMGALGWILAIATKNKKDAELVASFRAAKAKVPRDPQALWDCYYLSQLRYENAQAYEDARDLSRAAPTDPMAMWVFLYAVASRQATTGQRYYNQGIQETEDHTPPLPAEELEQLMTCYRSLRQQRPELLSAQFIQNVAAELKRAKRTADGDRLYREAVDSAQQLGQIAGVLGLAADRGDIDSLLSLSDRYDRLQTSPGTGYYAGNFYFQGTAQAISQGMNVRARSKAYDDVFRLLDSYLAAARRKQQQQPAGGRARNFGNPYSAGNIPYYTIGLGRSATNVQISFPLPNEYFDFGGITVLRTAFELFKRDDLTSDLVAHFRTQADRARGASDALYPRLALSYLLWWDDDKDASIAEFTKAAEQTKLESDMRLVLAELLEQRGDPEEALRLVDAVKPLDNATTQRREEQALRLAVLTGNLERAHKAAERLFGLRLDTDTQVRLAGQMNQLGLHELAEAILSRARRRAGNKAAVLVTLMLQYQRQQKNDVAVQIAQQILRSSSSQRNVNPNVVSANDPEQARSAAMQVLARSGKLADLIQRAQEQLKATPTSVQLHQTLADYYRAAGQRDKARGELLKIIELRPDDAPLRYQVANQLVQEGQAAAAIDHFKAALKKEPSLLGRNYFQVQNAFQQVNKTDELLALLDQIDLRSIGRSNVVSNIIQNMLNDDSKSAQAMRLFRKAWEAFPDERMNLIAYIHRDSFWQMPEMYDYARQGLIPDQLVSSPYGEWYAFERIFSFGADGRINSLVSKVLDLAVSQNRLDELTGQIEAARKKFPNWKPGKALLALAYCRAGKYEDAKKLVREVVDQFKNEEISSYIPWVIGAELENHGATRDLSTAVYESCLSSRTSDPYSYLQYDNSAIKRLVAMYIKEGRKDDARRVLQEYMKPRDFSNYPDEYVQQMRTAGQAAAARQLIDLGFITDAVPLYNAALTTAEAMPADAPIYYMDRDSLLQQIRDGLNQALQGMSTEDLAQNLLKFLDRGTNAGKTEPRKDKNQDGKEAAKQAARKPEQRIDMVVLVYPRALDKSTVRSIFDDSIQACAKQPGRLAEFEKQLEQLRQSDSSDLSVEIALSLTTLAGGKPEKVKEAQDRLNQAMARTPLETLPPGARANARQRAEALRQIPLWLVARACWRKPEWKENGDKLAAVALEAARRQSDNRWTMAMLREEGQAAIDHGDRKTAEAAWEQMLDAILVGDPKKKPVQPTHGHSGISVPPQTPVVPPPVVPSRTSTQMPAASAASVPVRRTSYRAQDAVPATAPRQVAPAPSRAARAPGQTGAPVMRAPGQPAPSVKTNVPLLTVDRFEQAMQVAKLAAANDLFALSARAVRESLKGGPPVVVEPGQNARRSRVVIMRGGDQEEPQDPVTPRVVAQVTELEAIWQRKNAPAELIYDTLRQVVLPDARPAEIFLYAQPINQGATLRPRSVGAILAAWACRASRTEPLLKAIEARKRLPMAQLPGSILAAQIALAAGHDSEANAALGAIADRLKRDTLRATAQLALLVALPALDRDATRKAALGVLEPAVRGFEGPNAREPLGSLLLILARNEFRSGDSSAGRKRLGEYLDVMERSMAQYYGGDYALYQRKVQLQRVANEFARAGLWTDALEWLGRFVDAPTYSGGDPSPGEALSLLVGQLTGKPAKERYEALKTWSLPTPSRRMVRLLAALVPTDRPPASLEKSRANATPAGKTAANGRLVSTATSLIDAATEAGTLDELARETNAAAEAKVENGDVLSLLVELARGKSKAVTNQLQTRLAELIKDNASPAPSEPNPRSGTVGQKPRGFPWLDYLVARAALAARSSDVHDLGLLLLEALAEQAQRYQNPSALACLHYDLAVEHAQMLGSSSIVSRAENGTPLWHAADYLTTITAGDSITPSLWVGHQGHVAHITGPENDLLMFDYPLTGTFELSFQAPHGSWQEAVCSYAGLVAEPFWTSDVFPVGASETQTIDWKLTRSNDFNDFTIQVSPARVRYIVNGHLFYEDKEPSPTSPWLGLFTHRERQTTWRNFTLKGTPVIPKEVKLCVADRLEGWVSSLYGETQPPRRTSVTSDRFGNLVAGMRRTRGTSNAAAASPRGEIDPDDYDWSAQEGVIRGRRLLRPIPTNKRYINTDQEFSLSTAAESGLTYCRPLLDGDSLTYEFRYEPGQVEVHPALDRLVFLLEPQGVRLHWMTRGPSDMSGLSADNAVDEPSARRGPAALPLRAGDWNTLIVALHGDVATLELNGQTILERRLEAGNNRQFGLFHDKDRTEVRVRNVVLKGRWPQTLAAEDHNSLVFKPSSLPGQESERRARHAVIGEPILCRQAGEILASARKLKPEERYTVLADWVLPCTDHPVFRLQGVFTPTDPVPAPGGGSPSRGSDKLKDEATQARQQTGGILEAPALELVDTAEKLGKLAELADRAASAPAEGEVNQRGKLALQALIQIARNDDAAAEKSIQELGALLAKLSQEQPAWVRWPEPVVCSRAIERPRLRKPALALLEPVIGQAQTKTGQTIWDRQFKNLRSRALVLSEEGNNAKPFGTDPDAAPWARVTHPRAETRGTGNPIPQWTMKDGQINHYPGHENDFFYLSIPLRGEFQFDCELTSFDWREIRVSYGGLTVGLKYDLKHLERFHYGRYLQEIALVPPFTKIGDWYPFRLVVKAGRMTTFIDGRKVHEAPLPAECDPWLAFFAMGHLYGGARKIRISGNPVIPERLNLTALPDLTGWLADYFGELVGVDNADWDKRGDEIQGRLHSDSSGMKLESVLRYNRPLLEDGEIDYEFYYEPGKTMVHPALDRLTLLLEPDGVKMHWLTDAQFERSGLKPNNASTETENLRGPASLPLKPKEWNRLSLSLAGDRVTVRLNQTEIYTRTLEPTNQRIFGLFHYADETDVRVRNVTYSGHWPRQLPGSLKWESEAIEHKSK